MIIHGIRKLTLLDYPEHTACTLFTGACSFRCPFCQNGGLVLHPEKEPVIDQEWIFSFLRKRKTVLEGVCISGGEPAIQKDLIPFIEEIRSIGYRIKLDTNGYHPEVLQELLEKKLIDAAAMDIKSSPAHYATAVGLPDTSFNFSRISESARLFMEYGFANPDFYYEFRTTMVKNLQTEEDMISIGQWLAGSEHYYLQRYEDSENVIDRSMESFSKQEMEKMADLIRPFIPNVMIRGS